MCCGLSADMGGHPQISGRSSADEWRIICRPNFGLTASNSFDLHISFS
jgi:hypothetical protein